MDIRWLGEPGCHDPAVVGGKAAQLSRLAADYPVPPGFCLPAGRGDDDGDALAAAYRALGARCGAADPAVAVRSSGLDEDGAAASFAGQHETYLNVQGIAAVAAAVARCRASARAGRAVAYRQARGLVTGEPAVAVLVQALVAADVAAVVFSAHPVTGDRDAIVVTASWGLGESIVGGTVTPDTWIVGKANLAIRDARIGAKARLTVAVPGGVREVDTPRFLREQPALPEDRVRELA
ncbi:MAG TPA: PEP/pyruvate-binding domain-containing protein, partial [Thermomicrobiales bacterium]|nr:PEP/pyruvate-binding domain-containing protein [Thermomicrobiales bacterium]